MPRTIRKRQLRNKKSRKQRGGELTEQQKKIKNIKVIIDANIDELIKLLGDDNTTSSNESVINTIVRGNKVAPDNTTTSTDDNTTSSNESVINTIVRGNKVAPDNTTTSTDDNTTTSTNKNKEINNSESSNNNNAS